MDGMNALDIARRLAELEQPEKACEAYTLYLRTCPQDDPEGELEGALYILRMGGNYKAAYDTFLSLYGRGHRREDCLSILTEAFYAPNEEELRGRYEKNCELLSRYPYLFRTDFLSFDELPIRFYPYDDDSYVPFEVESGRFGERVDFSEEIISRNFFHDLDKPVLAHEVWSQYELEYLRDNVRKSEWVARENHIYLHYPDWGAFCAHLQHWEWEGLLKEEKFVFLIGEEIEQYPIDFKERFGIDYSRCPLKPVSIREVTRMIWHTQLSSHNGGDFFNEIFDGHPNLLFLTSVMHGEIQEMVGKCRRLFERAGGLREVQKTLAHWGSPRLVKELYELDDRTDKDILVTLYLADRGYDRGRDRQARIAPAIFYQPHFYNIRYNFKLFEGKRAVLYAEEGESIRDTPFFQGFRYIKSFTPLRRFTTSHAATVRYMMRQREEDPACREMGMPDLLPQRILNRSFMVERGDRLFRDSVLVRFEDAKLNPTATFKALAAFVDLPYTESMTYCSFNGEQNPAAVGMSPEKVYTTYDAYANDTERYFLEYFLRDAYEFYGYDFHYYDGRSMNMERVRELVADFSTLDHLIKQTWADIYISQSVRQGREESEALRREAEAIAEQKVRRHYPNRIQLAEAMLEGLHFVDQKGRPLRMMPMLKLDPALLEQPLYH